MPLWLYAFEVMILLFLMARRTGAKIIFCHTYNIPFPILESYFLVHTRNQGVIRWNKNVQHVSYSISYPWWTFPVHSKTSFVPGSLPFSRCMSCRHRSLALCADMLTGPLKPNQPTKKNNPPPPPNQTQKGAKPSQTSHWLGSSKSSYEAKQQLTVWRWVDW